MLSQPQRAYAQALVHLCCKSNRPLTHNMLEYMMRSTIPRLKANHFIQNDNHCIALLAALLAARGVSSHDIGQFLDAYSPSTSSTTSWQSSPTIPLYTDWKPHFRRRSPRLVIDLSFNTTLTPYAASAVFAAALLLPSTYNIEVLLHGCSGVTSLSLDPWHHLLSSRSSTARLIGIRLDGCPIRFLPRQLLNYCQNLRWLSLRATRVESPRHMAEMMDSMPMLVAALFRGNPSHHDSLARTRKFATQVCFITRKSQLKTYCTREAISYRGYPNFRHKFLACQTSSSSTDVEYGKRRRRRRELRFPPTETSSLTDNDSNLGDDERGPESYNYNQTNEQDIDLSDRETDTTMNAEGSSISSYYDDCRHNYRRKDRTRDVHSTVCHNEDESEDDSYSEQEERTLSTSRLAESIFRPPTPNDFEINKVTPVTSHPHYKLFALAGARARLKMLDGEPIVKEEHVRAASCLASIYEASTSKISLFEDPASSSSSLHYNHQRISITKILHARSLGYSHPRIHRLCPRRFNKIRESPDLKRRRVFNVSGSDEAIHPHYNNDGSIAVADLSRKEEQVEKGASNMSHLSRPTQMTLAYAASTAAAAEAHRHKLDERTAARFTEHRRVVLMGIGFRYYYDAIRHQRSTTYRPSMLPQMLPHASLPSLDRFEEELTNELNRILGPGNHVPAPQPSFYRQDAFEGAITAALVNRPGPCRIRYFDHAIERPRQFEFNPMIPSVLAYGTEDGNLVVMNQETGDIIGSCRVGGGRGKRRARETIRSVRSLTNIARIPEEPDFPTAENTSSVFALSWLNKQNDMFISGTTDGRIHIYNVRRMHDRDGRNCAFACDTFNRLTSIHVNSNDTMFAVSGDSSNVGLFDIGTGTHTGSIKQCHNMLINVIKFAHHNPNILLTSSFDRCVKKWDLRECALDGRRRPIYTSNNDTDIVTVCFSPDDSRILVSGVDNEVRQLNAVDGSLERNFNIQKTGKRANFTRSYYMHNGEYIISGSSMESSVRIFNAKTGALHSETEMDDQRYLTPRVHYVQTIRANPWRRFNFSALLVSGNDWKNRVIANVDLLERDTSEW